VLLLTETSTVVLLSKKNCKDTAAIATVLAEQTALPVYSTDSESGKGVDTLLRVITHVGDIGWIIAGDLAPAVLRRRAVTAILRLKGARMPSARTLKEYVLLDEEEPMIWVHRRSHQLSAFLRIDGGQ